MTEIWLPRAPIGGKNLCSNKCIMMLSVPSSCSCSPGCQTMMGHVFWSEIRLRRKKQVVSGEILWILWWRREPSHCYRVCSNNYVVRQFEDVPRLRVYECMCDCGLKDRNISIELKYYPKNKTKYWEAPTAWLNGYNLWYEHLLMSTLSDNHAFQWASSLILNIILILKVILVPSVL